MGRQWKTLSQELEELERTNPDVRRAAENYDRVVAEILAERTTRDTPEESR